MGRWSFRLQLSINLQTTFDFFRRMQTNWVWQKCIRVSEMETTKKETKNEPSSEIFAENNFSHLHIAKRTKLNKPDCHEQKELTFIYALFRCVHGLSASFWLRLLTSRRCVFQCFSSCSLLSALKSGLNLKTNIVTVYRRTLHTWGFSDVLITCLIQC